MIDSGRADTISAPIDGPAAAPREAPPRATAARSGAGPASAGVGSRGAHARRPRVIRPLIALSVVAATLGAVAASVRHGTTPVSPAPRPVARPIGGDGAGPGPIGRRAIALSRAQQRAIRLRTEGVVSGPGYEEVKAPGRVAPDRGRFAFITPRAPGVVRSVAVNVGDRVRAGDVLATVDSPEAGRARLELRAEVQLLEVAEAQARWQEAACAHTLGLVEGLKRGEDPETLQGRLSGRPAGAGRERLLTAYARYRLASAALERHKGLVRGDAVSLSQFQQVRATHEAASATYHALLESTAYDARLEDLRARQALRRAETAVGVARERLKILGVDAGDGSGSGSESGLRSGDTGTDSPLSTYTLVAPLDGTVLDRASAVPGVSVDVTRSLFTVADLSTVWLEVDVSEGDFDALARAGDGELRFGTPAYPGRSFRGRVLYRGDLVDEASRTVKLLASAPNPDRLLKPGMFIRAEVRCPGPRPTPWVSESALVTEGGGSFVFVRTGPESFERREVLAGPATGGRVAVARGLVAGEEVVVEGAFKLKARAIALEVPGRRADAPAEGRGGGRG